MEGYAKKGNPGMKSKGKVMKNHGNTQKCQADNQKYDMGRVQKRGHEMKGNLGKAFEYKY